MLNQNVNNRDLEIGSLTKERKSVTHQFDELIKSLVQSVPRRAALKKFGVSLAGMALACFGLTNQASADSSYTPIDYPGANLSNSNVYGNVHGLLYSGGVFSSIDSSRRARDHRFWHQ